LRLIVGAAALVVGLAIYLVTRGSAASAAAVFINYGGVGVAAWGVLMLSLGWGLGNVVFGMLVFASGIYPIRNDWVSDLGMVHTQFGVVLTLCGWQVMRVAWFPIAFLLCALPWPGLFYSKLAGPLQALAAGVTVRTLNFTGIDAFREGTKMFISGSSGGWRPLNVAEACAGLRSLMTFITLGAAVAFLSNRALWQKMVITLSAIPIAIFCNVLRVTGQAYIDRIAGPQWSENFAHQFVGVVMLIPAFFLILGVAWALDQIFVEEADDKAKFNRAPATPRAAATEKKVIVVATKPAALAGATAKAVAVPAPAAKTHAAHRPEPSTGERPPRPAACPRPGAPGNRTGR
jgi:exosortase